MLPHPITTDWTIPASTFDTNFTEPLDRSHAARTLKAVLPKIWENLPSDESGILLESAQDQGVRVVAVILHRDVDRGYFNEAMDACAALWDLDHGACLVHAYGYANTDENRDYWLDQKRRNLTSAIANLTAGIPERARAA